MSDVTQILGEIDKGDPTASERLLPLVYKELRKLAIHKLNRENPGQTLQATALVHEAYIRLVDVEQDVRWTERGHFFAAAAEAMRRILIENARHRSSLKRGGGLNRHDLLEYEIAAPQDPTELLALDDALDRLCFEDAESGQLVKLRYFAGLTVKEAAEVLNISPRKADFLWSFARAWLRREIGRG